MKYSFLLLIIFSASIFSQEKSDLIQTTERFSPNGHLVREELMEKFYTIEVGSLNNVSYRIWYSDASGSFAAVPGKIIDATTGRTENWSVSCKKDAIDDSKLCYMHFRDLWIFNASDGPWLSIGGDIYPGSEVAIRIDGAPAIKGGNKGMFLGEAAKRIIELLKTGKEVTTRYTKWPAGTDKDDTFQLYGFNEALAYINWAITKIK